MRMLLIDAVFIILGVLGSRVIFSSLYKSDTPFGKAFSYLVGAAIAGWFYLTWARTGMDPVQLAICSNFEQAQGCQGRKDLAQSTALVERDRGYASMPAAPAAIAAPVAPKTVLFEKLSASLGPLVPEGRGRVLQTSNGAYFECFANATSSGRRSISGSEIVIESRMHGIGRPYINGAILRDTAIALVDEQNGSRIQVGDTNYNNNGLYVSGSGDFENVQIGNGNSVGVPKEYRLTLTDKSLKLERGDSLSRLTEMVTRRLPTSINGRKFFLSIGTGGPDYCPSVFEWISVKTV